MAIKANKTNVKMYAAFSGVPAGCALKVSQTIPPVPGSNDPRHLPVLAMKSDNSGGTKSFALAADAFEIQFEVTFAPDETGKVTASFARDIDPFPRPSAGQISVERTKTTEDLSVSEAQPIEWDV